jgi:hypothetical protein
LNNLQAKLALIDDMSEKVSSGDLSSLFGTSSDSSSSSSSDDSSDIDWIDRRIELLKQKRSELETAMSDTYIAYVGLTKEEINRAKELFSTNISPESDALNELITLANKAGLSIGELQQKIQSGSGLESRQSYLESVLALDKQLISEYTDSTDKYRESYEISVMLCMAHRDVL